MYTLRLTVADLEQVEGSEVYDIYKTTQWVIEPHNEGIRYLAGDARRGLHLNGKIFGSELTAANPDSQDLSAFRAELVEECGANNVDHIGNCYAAYLCGGLIIAEIQPRILELTNCKFHFGSSERFDNLYQRDNQVFLTSELQSEMKSMEEDTSIKLDCMWKITHVLTENGFKLVDIQLTNPGFKGLLLNDQAAFALLIASGYINDILLKLKKYLLKEVDAASSVPIEQVFAEMFQILENPFDDMYFKLIDKFETLKNSIRDLFEELNSEPEQKNSVLEIRMIKIGLAHSRVLEAIVKQLEKEEAYKFVEKVSLFCIEKRKYATLRDVLPQFQGTFASSKVVLASLEFFKKNDFVSTMRLMIVAECMESNNRIINKWLDEFSRFYLTAPLDPKKIETFAELVEPQLQELEAFDQPRAFLFRANFHQEFQQYAEALELYQAALESLDVESDKESASKSIVELLLSGKAELGDGFFPSGLATSDIHQIAEKDNSDVQAQKMKKKQEIFYARAIPAYRFVFPYRESDWGIFTLTRIHSMLAGFEGTQHRSSTPNWLPEAVNSFGDYHRFCVVELDFSEYIIQKLRLARQLEREQVTKELSTAKELFSSITFSW